jgi:hypothetical protein
LTILYLLLLHTLANLLQNTEDMCNPDPARDTQHRVGGGKRVEGGAVACVGTFDVDAKWEL